MDEQLASSLAPSLARAGLKRLISTADNGVYEETKIKVLGNYWSDKQEASEDPGQAHRKRQTHVRPRAGVHPATGTNKEV